MKTISFIFHQHAAYAVEWQTLVETDNPDNIFVLVTTKDCMEKMTADSFENFRETIIVHQFEFSELAAKMDATLQIHYHADDQVRIAVLSEFTMTVAANLRDHFKPSYQMVGPGRDVIDCYRDKLKMKKILGEAEIRLPRYLPFNADQYIQNPDATIQNLEDHLGYPMFMKPTDSGGSIGTAYIPDQQALMKFCNNAAAHSDQQYEIDEFIDGDLYHCDSIVQNGEVKFTFVNRYLHPNADARSGKALASMTMNPASTDYQELKSFAERILKLFPETPDGFTHMEIFKNHHGELIFLEVAARAPGAKAPESFKVRTGGIDMRWVHLRLNLGLSIDNQLKHLSDAKNWGPYAAMFQLLAPAEGGIVTRMVPPKFTGGGYTLDHRFSEGDELTPNQSILDAVYSCVFWNENYDAMLADFLKLDQQQVIEFAPPKRDIVKSFFPESILKVFQITNTYLSALGDSLANYALDYAKSVKKDCPSYFPPDCPHYWSRSTSSTLFQSNRSLCDNTSFIAPPPTVPRLP